MLPVGFERAAAAHGSWNALSSPALGAGDRVVGLGDVSVAPDLVHLAQASTMTGPRAQARPFRAGSASTDHEQPAQEH